MCPLSEQLLIQNADVITLNQASDVLPGVNVAIADGRILAVGDVPPGFVPSRTIDATDHVALPGFWNAHTHAPMAYIRGWADDIPIERWFNERVWRVESALTAEDVRWSAYLAAAEMIRSGTVGFADHYFFMDEVAEVVAESGLKANLAWAIFGEGSGKGMDPRLDQAAAFTRRWQDGADGRIVTWLGPHSPYLCDATFLRRTVEVAAELDVGLHIHVAETPEQTRASLAQHGLSPVAYLDRLGFFSRPTIAAHCVGTDQADIETLAARGVSVAQATGCYMKLGMGVPPLPQMLTAGVNVGLGTDGEGNNNDLDLLQEAQLTSLLHKSHTRDATILPGDTVLRLATQGSAQAMGFPESGVIAPGHPADLILFDFRKPHLRPRHDLVSNLVYAAKSPDISHVIVNGKLLLEDGALTTLDEERILYEAERRAWHLVGREFRNLRAYAP
jgi:5-methylthioadenosine/S-adenosylhomocysteine deaminase